MIEKIELLRNIGKFYALATSANDLERQTSRFIGEPNGRARPHSSLSFVRLADAKQGQNAENAKQKCDKIPSDLSL
jgi:hypothetical protein